MIKTLRIDYSRHNEPTNVEPAYFLNTEKICNGNPNP